MGCGIKMGNCSSLGNVSSSLLIDLKTREVAELSVKVTGISGKVAELRVKSLK